jgi:hypothetical protein
MSGASIGNSAVGGARPLAVAEHEGQRFQQSLGDVDLPGLRNLSGDVPYWLETLDALNLFRQTRDWTDLDRQLAASMSDALVAFANSGNPNTSGQSDWPKYRSDVQEVRELGSSNRAVLWPDSAGMDFFAAQSATRVGADTRPVPGRNRD